jgi:hypothetical protein
MTAAKNSALVVPIRHRWWSVVQNAWVKVASASIAIAAGTHLWATHSRRGDPEYLFNTIVTQYPDSVRNGMPAFLTDALWRALVNDLWVIAGYPLILLTCAMVFRALAFSKSGYRLSHFMLAAVGIAIVAHLLEDAFIYLVLNRPSSRPTAFWDDAFWIYASGAMATVKWCALVVAVAVIPAAVFSVVRVILSHPRRLRYRRRYGTNWWDDALSSPTPEPVEDDTEAAWRQAYFVPEADLVPDRDDGHAERVQMPTALCLSGGGIRSACVAMGAMQELARPRGNGPDARSAPMLDNFDYVISVSGGGFGAGARLLGVQREPTRDSPGGGAITALGERFSPGSVEFDYVRRHCNYIADSPLALLRALAEILKNLLASLLIVASSAIVLGWLLGMFVSFFPFKAVVPRDAGAPPPPENMSVIALQARPVAALAAVAIPVAATIICIVGALACEWASASRRSTTAEAMFTWLGRRAALLALLVFVLSVAGPGLMWLCLHRPDKGGAIGGIAAVVLLQYGAALMSITSKNHGVLNPTRWLKLVPSEVVRTALVLFTLGVLLIGWLVLLGIVAAFVFNMKVDHAIANKLIAQPLFFDVSDVQWRYLGGIALLALLLSSFDVTSLSLHPFFRERLAHTFAVRRRGGTAVEYAADEMTWLDKYGKAQTGRPRFVFAAAAAISDGDIRPAPGLNAVSFVMTADYVGGPALGWLKTAALRRASPPRIKRDLTVEAAMAVSGAAFASAMGRHRNGIRTLLALSGARLGTWLPNPVFVRNAQRNAARLSFPKALPSVRGAGYFYRELLGINKFDARLVQVTDGGHYENLGLVEALRRRCRLIYCIDSSGDDPPLLSGLAEAIRLARFELGIEIIMESGGPFGVENLAPGSGNQFGANHAFHSLNARVTKGAVARGRISYPEASGIGNEDARTGWLIIAKAVLWRELPDWVLTYAAEQGGAEFPHDTTSGQWFSEGQFAAYTEVGRSVAVRAMQVPGDGSFPAPETPPEAATPNGDVPPPTPTPALAQPVVPAPARVAL